MRLGHRTRAAGDRQDPGQDDGGDPDGPPPGSPDQAKPSGGGSRPRRSGWLAHALRRGLPGPESVRAAEADASEPGAGALPPLRGLLFALGTIGRVSAPLLAVMLGGRFLSALLPAAALWVQRDLLNLLGTWVTARLIHRGTGPGSVLATVQPRGTAPVHALLVLLLALLLINLAFAKGRPVTLVPRGWPLATTSPARVAGSFCAAAPA